MHKSLPVLLLSLLAPACSGPPPGPDAGIAVGKALGGGSAAGFARAEGPRSFHFPADHGPHPAFRNEWWYLTGNLADADGRHFGYQVTFFRVALAPKAPVRTSHWATRQVWMAHAAITDVAAGTHPERERLMRGALGLAGARAAPLRVWTGDWSLAAKANDGAWRLHVSDAHFALELALAPLGPPRLQGDAGLSRKSAAPGNASYYYSIPRLATRGRLRSEGRAFTVHGLSWLDREWSTSALGPDQAGWDWFSMQFDDGTDLMYYRLRRKDGSTDPYSRGAAWTANGKRLDLGPQQVRLKPETWWTSPRGVRYPVGWRFEVPALKRAIRVRALVPNQLMDLSVIYWEGAVELLDADDGRRLGFGYLELAGYGRRSRVSQGGHTPDTRGPAAR